MFEMTPHIQLPEKYKCTMNAFVYDLFMYDLENAFMLPHVPLTLTESKSKQFSSKKQ